MVCMHAAPSAPHGFSFTHSHLGNPLEQTEIIGRALEKGREAERVGPQQFIAIL